MPHVPKHIINVQVASIPACTNNNCCSVLNPIYTTIQLHIQAACYITLCTHNSFLIPQLPLWNSRKEVKINK